MPLSLVTFVLFMPVLKHTIFVAKMGLRCAFLGVNAFLDVNSVSENVLS